MSTRDDDRGGLLAWVSRHLGITGPDVDPGGPTYAAENPVQLEPIVVQARATRPAAADPAGQTQPWERDGMPILAPMLATPLNRERDPQRVFAQLGILPQMVAADTARARRLYEAVSPFGYEPTQKDWDAPARIDHGVIASKTGTYGDYLPPARQSRALRVARALVGMENDERPPARSGPEREDAWRIYLGIPQEEGTFDVSQYRPARESDPSAVYFSLPREREHLNPERLRDLVETARQGGGRAVLDMGHPVMGSYTVGVGEDERGQYLSYYDKWDLAPSQGTSGAPGVKGPFGAAADWVAGRIGQPYEIYDRIYFDPATHQQIEVPAGSPRSATQPRGSTMQPFLPAAVASAIMHSAARGVQPRSFGQHSGFEDMRLRWRGRGLSSNVEDRRNTGSEDYGSYADAKIGRRSGSGSYNPNGAPKGGR